MQPKQSRPSKAAPKANQKTSLPPTARSARKSKADSSTASSRSTRSRKPKSGKSAPAPAPQAKRPASESTRATQTTQATRATKQRLPILNDSVAAKSQRKPTCTACGLCCSYVAIEVDAPASVKSATLLLWYVYHDKVSLYVNADEWMVQFDTTCIHLQPDYRCGVYTTRPHICREFSEQDCEVNTGDDGHTFYTATEFLAYLKQTRPRIHGFIQKNFAPPVEPVRTTKEPFEQRFGEVLSRRQALGIEQ